MNTKVTTTAAKLFPYAGSSKTRDDWEEQCLNNWLNDPTQTPHVQALRRSPNYLETYAKNPPKLGY
tara:strand:- start:20 stop:217 length:198 start_codon:yes stop_codon:yes gene_type:complete